MSIKTFFANSWHNFLDWFTSAEAEVVQEAKTIIDELVPLVRAKLFEDGSALLINVAKGLASGKDPLVAITEAATDVWKTVKEQGSDISKAASTAAGAILVAKAKELAANMADQ